MNRRIGLLILLLLCLGAVSATAGRHSATKLTCVQQCVANGVSDPICCRYLCHPIGQNPC